MKIDAMLALTPEERAAKEKELVQSLFSLRLQKATGQLENPMRIREVRKEIARLKTVVSGGATGSRASAGEGGAPAAEAAVVTAPKAPKKAVAPAPAKKAAPKAAPKAAAKPAAKKAAPPKASSKKTGKGK